MMREYTLIVYSNPAPGLEAEYNDWYNNVHLKDVLSLPDFRSARRYKLSDFKLDEQMPDPSYRYIAFYNMTSEDPQTALNDLRSRVETGLIALSPAMDPQFLAYCYQAVSDLQSA